MARRARIKFSSEDAVYHVYNRVIGPFDWRPLFDPEARRLFFRILAFLLDVYCVEPIAYCLMGTHYHLILWVRKATQLSREDLERRAAALWSQPRHRPKTDEQWRRFNDRLFDLSAFMKDLQCRFTREFNRLNERRGPLWSGRFKSTLLGPEAVLVCLHYVEFNPVAASLTKRPEDWVWSSARARLRGTDSRLWPLTRVTGIPDPAAALRWFEESRTLYRANREARARESWWWLQARVVGSADFVARFIDTAKEPTRRPLPMANGDWYALDRLRLPRDPAIAA